MTQSAWSSKFVMLCQKQPTMCMKMTRRNISCNSLQMTLVSSLRGALLIIWVNLVSLRILRMLVNLQLVPAAINSIGMDESRSTKNKVRR